MCDEDTALIDFGFKLGERFAKLEHRVAEMEKVFHLGLDKIAKELSADAAATDAATKANPVPAT